MPRDDLTRRAARLLLAARVRAGLSQGQVAERAGSTQQWVSKVERAAVSPRLADLQRLLAAVGVRMLMQSAPLATARDDDPDLLLVGRDDELRYALGLHRYALRMFARVPYVIGGRLAALLQGLPVRPTSLDLLVREADADGTREALGLLSVLRFNERWQDFRDYDADPTAPGPLRWRIAGPSELRLSLLPELPASLTVSAGDGSYRVRPLADLLIHDEDVADLADRLRTWGGAASAADAE